MSGTCPRCGNPTFFSYAQGQLCTVCDKDFQIQRIQALNQEKLLNEQRRAHAQHEAMRRKQQEDHEAAIQRQQEEERERKKREWATFINDYPAEIERLLSSVTDNTLLAVIARLAEFFKSIDVDQWLLLSITTPFEAPITYNRFRTLLVPRIVEWWRMRDTLSPSPIPMLKVIAKSLLYTDFEGMNIAKHQLPKALLALDAELANANMLANSLPGQIADKESFIQKLAEDLQRTEDSLKVAEKRTINPNEVEEELKAQDLKARRVGLGCLGVAIILAFVITVGKILFQGRFSVLSTIERIAILATPGILILTYSFIVKYISIKRRTERAVGVKDKEHKKLIAKKQSAIARIRVTLAAAQEEQARMEVSLPRAKDTAARLKRNRKCLPDEMLQGHIDEQLNNIII